MFTSTGKTLTELEKFGSIGLGCMGLSGVYGAGLSDEDFTTFIKAALTEGVRFFDTADVYDRTVPALGVTEPQKGHNERLLGSAISAYLASQTELQREDICVATKVAYQPGFSALDFSKEHIIKACNDSLQALWGTGASNAYIDLYYLHRMPKREQWDECLEALYELVISGKIHRVGLSEPSTEFIRYAHAFFADRFPLNSPLAAVETEFSIFSPGALSQNSEAAVLDRPLIDVCAELNLSFSPYGSLGHGLLTSTLNAERNFDMNQGDLRGLIPRFQGENFTENLRLRDQLAVIAHEIGCTLEQLALAWSIKKISERHCRPILIPGTTNIDRLRQNLATHAIEERLSPSIMSRIDAIAPHGAYGERQPEGWRELHNVPKSPVNERRTATFRAILADSAIDTNDSDVQVADL